MMPRALPARVRLFYRNLHQRGAQLGSHDRHRALRRGGSKGRTVCLAVEFDDLLGPHPGIAVVAEYFTDPPLLRRQQVIRAYSLTPRNIPASSESY